MQQLGRKHRTGRSWKEYAFRIYDIVHLRDVIQVVIVDVPIFIQGNANVEPSCLKVRAVRNRSNLPKLPTACESEAIKKSCLSAELGREPAQKDMVPTTPL